MPQAPDRRLRLTVLDRLVDDAPREALDTAAAWEAPLEEVRERLLRDVEWLLNTRRIVEPAPDSYPELCHSVYHFGLPDLTSLPDTDESKMRLARSVEECLAVFEPRLLTVHVTPGEAANEKGERRLHLVIEGMLRADPSPARVVFDTVVETGSGRVVVTGAADA